MRNEPKPQLRNSTQQKILKIEESSKHAYHQGCQQNKNQKSQPCPSMQKQANYHAAFSSAKDANSRKVEHDSPIKGQTTSTIPVFFANAGI